MRGYSGLNMQIEVIEDKNHYSVFPGFLSCGLMAALPLNK